MTGDIGQLVDGNGILIGGCMPFPLFGNAMSVPTFVEQPAGKIEIFGVTGYAVKFCKSQFNLFVAGDPVAFAWSENTHHVFNHADSDIEQGAVSGCQQVGDAGFDEVSCAIHFVRIHIGPTVVQSFFEGVIGVDVSVGLLGCGNFGNPAFGCFTESRVGVVDQVVRDPFESFVHIRVIEKVA